MHQITKIERFSPDIIIQQLQMDFPYSLNWSFEKIKIAECKPSCKYVYMKRLEYSRYIENICRMQEIPLYWPITVTYTDGMSHLILPPIMERRNNILLVCDGMHRLYSLLNSNVIDIYALVVNKPLLPLAGDINHWNNVKLELNQLPVENNFINFNREGYTGYSKYCNSPQFWNYTYYSNPID